MALRATKEKVAYWATKLECPVDENADYENTYVGRR
jgi:nucleobase:cation symporter-1, NCS1 family